MARAFSGKPLSIASAVVCTAEKGSHVCTFPAKRLYRRSGTQHNRDRGVGGDVVDLPAENGIDDKNQKGHTGDDL